MSRTYAYAIAGSYSGCVSFPGAHLHVCCTVGTPSKMSFDVNSARFELVFTPEPSCSADTEIFLNEAWYYPNGFTVTFTPSDGGSYKSIAMNRIAVTAQTTGELALVITANQ